MKLSRESIYVTFLVLVVVLDQSTLAYKSGCSGGYCFVVSDYNQNGEVVTQDSAKSWCLSYNNSQLVEIISGDIQASLTTVIQSLFSGGINGWSVITNGQRTQSWNWMRLNQAGQVESSIRVNGQVDASYAYAYLKSSSSGPGFDIYASRPTDNRGYICIAGASYCSGGGVTITPNGQCYRSSTEPISWYDARNRCLNLGGDLATFDYITSNSGFNALNGSWLDASKQYWVGIRSEWWTWTGSNSDVRYSDWLSGHPYNDVGRSNSDCLCLTTTAYWQWTECGCTQTFPFACLLSSPSTVTSTTRTSTSSVGTSISPSSGSSNLGATTSSGSSVGSENSMPAETNQLSSSAKIGIGVGVGIGGFFIIVVVVAVVSFIIIRKRRLPRKTNQQVVPPPDVIGGHSGVDNPYAIVMKADDSNNINAAAYNELNSKPIYADFEILRNSSHNKDLPSRKEPKETKHYANITKA